MTTLPTYTRTEFQRASALDLLALWGAVGSGAGCGTDAIYRKGGTGAGVLVRVYLSQKPPGMLAPGLPSAGAIGAGGAVGSSAQQRRFWLCALVMEPGTAFTAEGGSGGVGADGGIAELKRGDTLEVAGIAAGRPEDAVTVLKVGGAPRVVNGVQWSCEVSP